MNIPAELKYTKDHEWVRVEGNIAIVGITDFAQSELGDIVYVEVETEGEELAKEEIFGTVEEKYEYETRKDTIFKTLKQCLSVLEGCEWTEVNLTRANKFERGEES